MQTELVRKTADCAGNDCPALRKVTSAEGGYVIIGRRVSAADRAGIPGIGDGEDALWVPADVIEHDRA
jgi:hypothetical protein